METSYSPKMAPADEMLVTRQELSIRWRCSLSTIKRLQADGILTPLKIGANSVRYRMSDILEAERKAEMCATETAAAS